MRTLVDPQFRAEAERYALRFTCESCAHFEPDSERCANGYPNQEHRKLPLSTRASLLFCKEYELT